METAIEREMRLARERQPSPRFKKCAIFTSHSAALNLQIRHTLSTANTRRNSTKYIQIVGKQFMR